MKNHLTFTLATAIVGMLSIGCNKESVSPNAHQNHFSNSLNSASEVDPSTFMAVKKNGTGLLINTPENAKQVIAITDYKKNEFRKKAYHKPEKMKSEYFHISADVVSESFSIKYSSIYPSSIINKSKTEVFAIDRALTSEEVKALESMNRDGFRNYCSDTANNLNIVKSAIVKDAESTTNKLSDAIKKAVDKIGGKEAQKNQATTRQLTVLDFDIDALKRTNADRQRILNKINTL